jgi:hypothetical protein
MLLVRKDVGSHLAVPYEGFFTPAVITSGAGNDGVAVTGNVIDRLLPGAAGATIAGRGLAQSAKIVINWHTVLTNTKTLALQVSVSHAAAASSRTALTSGATLVPQIMRARYQEIDTAVTQANLTSTWTAVVPASGVVTATVSTGATSHLTRDGVMEIDLNLSEANRYIQVSIKATLNAGASDTVALSAVCVLGGFDEEPAQ